MKIKSIRIENFRSFKDETILLNDYTCFVGPNGAGKSTVLAALNVFFQEKSAAATDVSALEDEDFHHRNIGDPARITVTFHALSSEAGTELSAYARQNELVVTAEAVFDAETRRAPVRHFGTRMGMDAFRDFFGAYEGKASAGELKEKYANLKSQFTDLPAAKAKDDMYDALRAYEAKHSDQCVPIPSNDNFYGFNGTGKLAKYIQWIYVPAVKEVSEEGQEGRNTALGKLVDRVVRSKSNFDMEIDELKERTLEEYVNILNKNQDSLKALSDSLQARLTSWAHGGARIGLAWHSDKDKSVQVQKPVAALKAGDSDFVGSLTRMGHGLQRSYLLALLQELAESNSENQTTLLLGIEEPELYQHPPQARHLSDVLNQLATGNSQVFATTHSPYFLSGKGFENTRVVRSSGNPLAASVRSATFEKICERIRDAKGEIQSNRVSGMVSKIHQSLQPHLAEMFFCRTPILVEGLEDVAYITTELHLSGLWSDFRKLGCHIVPVNGKDRLVQPLAIAAELDIPVYTIFDADGDLMKNPKHKNNHENDNRAIFALIDKQQEEFFPTADKIGEKYSVWTNNLGESIKTDFDRKVDPIIEKIRVKFSQEGGLEKQDLFIASWLHEAKEQGYTSPKLNALCRAILSFAQQHR